LGKVRTTYTILEKCLDKEFFYLAFRVVKDWAKLRQLYSFNFNHLYDLEIAMLVCYAINSFNKQHHRVPKEQTEFLIHFFKIFSQWNPTRPIMLQDFHKSLPKPRNLKRPKKNTPFKYLILEPLSPFAEIRPETLPYVHQRVKDEMEAAYTFAKSNNEVSIFKSLFDTPDFEKRYVFCKVGHYNSISNMFFINFSLSFFA
jgi:poly(A) polymerase Pap1